jgi:hypothetical protein
MFITGVPINVDKDYPEFIGIKLIPLQPAAIIKNAGGIGIHIPYTIPYGKLIAKIPEGTIITIEHIVRKYNVENEANDTLMGRVDIPGYRGLFAVAICNAKEIDRCIDPRKFRII